MEDECKTFGMQANVCDSGVFKGAELEIFGESVSNFQGVASHDHALVVIVSKDQLESKVMNMLSHLGKSRKSRVCNISQESCNTSER